MPTSILLAVLAAAGLLALAPALTRRYDASERVAAERATSTARVLRRRGRRTVPGARPVNPPSWLVRRVPVPAPRRSGSSGASRSPSSGASRPWSSGAARSRSRSPRVGRRRPPATALHRRRRVFLALVLLNVVELAGVFLVGPGFWIGFSVSFVVLLADLVYLRQRAVVAQRHQRLVRRREAWVAREQAAVRREHSRRAAERAATTRRVVQERDAARRGVSPGYVERYRATPS